MKNKGAGSGPAPIKTIDAYPLAMPHFTAC
jgi:hypothetical protein